MFWKKKEAEVEQKKQKLKKQKPKTVEFCVDDDCFVRAVKLFQLINLGDNGRLSDSMARGIKIYMDLDKKKRNG